MARAPGHGDVAGGLGLAVDGQRAEGLVLRVDLGGAVEDVVGGYVDERDPVPGAGAGEQRRAGRIGLPGGHAALGGLRFIHGGVGAAVDHGAVERPVVFGVGVRVGHVEGVDVAEVEVLGDAALLGERAHRMAQLAVAAGDEGAPGRHGDDVLQHRVVFVRLGYGGLVERDRPLDGELGVGEVHEGVGPLELEGPVGVHQVGVGGAVLQGLEGVAHAARDVDGLGRVERAGEHLPVGLAALAQVHPGAEDAAARHGDELVPGLGVDAAGDAAAVVVGDVVLDDTEVGDAQGGHLGALPVLLEPAARVAVDGEVDDHQAPDAGLGDGEVLLECDVCHVDLPLPIAPGPCTWPRWPPWPGATRTRWRRTSRWWPSGPRRSRCGPASSRARAAACWSRWRSGGHGRGGRRPSRSPRGRAPSPPGSCAAR